MGYKKTRTAEAPVTLAEAGVDKNLANRTRAAGRMNGGQLIEFGCPASYQFLTNQSGRLTLNVT